MVPWYALARLYGWSLRVLGYQGRIRGMGFLLRRVGQDHIIEAEGLRIHFNHHVGGCYDALVARKRFGESETHRFLASVLRQESIGTGVVFLDVGANIGELSLDLARHPKVESVIAFEPNAECARSLAESAALNRLEKEITIRQVALNSSGGQVRFHIDTRSPNASHLAGAGETRIEVPASTLDHEAKDLAGTVILKIDVEGAELEVLRGARMTLERCLPLIVFEYNDTTRLHFALDELRNLLGPDYCLWRLRGDGLLDQDFKATWNCVAAHRATTLGDVCRSLAVA